MRPHRNRALFSNYYLDELLPKEEEFNIPISEVKAVFEKVKGIWDKSRFEAISEDQLRKHFLDKVLDYLGWAVDVNEPVPTGEWPKRPDYALFLNNESLKAVQRKKDDYFKKVICIAEAKRWGRPLDKKLKTEADPFEIQNPSLQISRYLWLTGAKWGILTDGKYWRLYERESSRRLDVFYEIDLEDLIESGSPEDFRYFYLLFRKDAFPEFIEKVYKGSVDYAEEVGEELKENIYQALKTLAQGFLKTPGNNLSEEYLKEIHDNALILLYRLLFILYAEHRDLLPLGDNKLYTESYSLDAFKKEIANKFDKNVPIASSTIGYWNKLKELFEIINKGNKELGVPPYNGGLFDQEKHNFLEKHKVGDSYVAKAIDLLSRSRDKAYIDYGSLEIRHLGSIYEGLLEYKLKIADQDLVPIKDKGKEKFVSLIEAKKAKKSIREDEIIQAGEIYLVTDKGERKATGSYYTPDYIVKYIVENTLEPLVEEKRKKISEKINELKGKLKGTKGLTRESYEKELRKVEGSLIDEILSLKVLDPAMGSGHFLVEAITFLARALIEAFGESPEETGEDEIRWARREVVERCIFGVDLNPMAVELAKLSLWLYTVAKNRPLNFLDHHLRCGNSLIGAKIDDLSGLPELKKKKAEGAPVQLGLFESIFREKVNILLGAFAQIEMLSSDTVEQVTKKEKLYQDFRKIVSRFQDVADVWTIIYFENDVSSGNYQKLQNNLRSTEEEWKRLSQESWFKKAKDIANAKRFFHWELEFPEVFFEGHQKKENPGFDAVIGNPPYETSRSKGIEQETKQYLSLYPVAEDKYDYYWFFINKGNELKGHHKYFSMIIPDTWLMKPLSKNLRKYLLENSNILSIDLLGFSAFKQIVPTCILTVTGPINKANRIVFRDSNFTNMFVQNQSEYNTPPHYFISPYLSNTLININEKGRKRGYSLGQVFVKIYNGVQTGNDKKYLSNKKISNLQRPIIRGADVDRYQLSWGGTYILWLPDELHSNQRESIYQYSPKILIRQTADRLIATIDRDKNISLATTFVLIKDNKIQEKEEYLLAMLNSKLLNFLYQSFNYEVGRIQPQIKRAHIEQLPISHISFITPKSERAQKVEVAKNHYKKYLEIGKSDSVLYLIESTLMNEHNPDAELVKKHNADPLNKDWQIPEGILWEQLDVVHDTLAFLAEQLIEMNKEKQREIKGYLGWLESQLKIQSDADGNSGIEGLAGKTQIKNYLGDYQKNEEPLPFEEFWKILEKNKTRIKANLKSRELYENIKSEYEKSLSKLLPLKEKLHKTDWLIDQIVYKLYGLTEDEIKKVEQG